MGTVVTITSGKGGTGKTSITGGIAASLALMGRRVLRIDMDIGLPHLNTHLSRRDMVLIHFAVWTLGRYLLDRGAVRPPG